MIDRFESALRKINRARKHVDDLEAEVHAFWNAEPYEIDIIGGSFAGRSLYRVRRMAAPPESIPLIAGDAAHNIRSALDHFAWAAASPEERNAYLLPGPEQRTFAYAGQVEETRRKPDERCLG